MKCDACGKIAEHQSPLPPPRPAFSVIEPLWPGWKRIAFPIAMPPEDWTEPEGGSTAPGNFAGRLDFIVCSPECEKRLVLAAQAAKRAGN
jgi:hypothetical protein